MTTTASTADADTGRQARSRGPSRSFWQLMTSVTVVAGMAHVVFCALFAALGAWTMAWVNVGSVVLFGASYVLLRRRHNRLALVAIVVELFMHAALGVRLIGWDSGFHYYLIMMPPVVMISPMKRSSSRLILGGSVCAAYIALDVLTRTTVPVHHLSPTVLALMRSFNVCVMFALLMFLSTSYMRMVRQAEGRLREAATTDMLTRLMNRRRITEVFQYEVTQRKREVSPLSFVVCDVDHFKRINDAHGHDAGDKVLVAVATALRNAVREQDSVGRWGGEEFLVLMPNTTTAQAVMVAERMRQAVAGLRLHHGEQPLPVSMSFGVATLRKEEEAESAVSRADQALYRAKQAGRDRVVGDFDASALAV